MTVGESLSDARHRAGLSVDELSERTRIRGMVIRSIERDDYQACGGDLYVRGYVRAIASAVGIDAQPLIHQYDQGRATAMIATTATRFDLPRFPDDTVATRFDLPPVSEDLMAAGYELPPEGMAAYAGSAARDKHAHAGVEGARPRTRGRGRGLLIGVAAVVLLAVAGVVGVRLAPSGTTSRNTAAASVPRTATSSAPAAKAAAPPKPARPAKPARSAGTRHKPARLPVTTLPVTTLPIAAAEAFGSEGLADGDNPATARYAIAGDAPLPWSTQWYVTPRFGMLKHGTGLLLDLGRRVTITSVRLDLADHQGAGLQLRVGDTASPGDLRVAATATGTGGAVRLTLPGQTSARYLLIWFTLLPPDGSGHYQESVSHVLVNGRRP